jgi:hypothetical protein
MISTPELRKAKLAQPVFQRGEIELRHGEGLRARQEADSVPRLSWAAPTTRAALAPRRRGTPDELLLPVAPDGQLEPGRERIHDRNADTVQAA